MPSLTSTRRYSKSYTMFFVKALSHSHCLYCFDMDGYVADSRVPHTINVILYIMAVYVSFVAYVKFVYNKNAYSLFSVTITHTYTTTIRRRTIRVGLRP